MKPQTRHHALVPTLLLMGRGVQLLELSQTARRPQDSSPAGGCPCILSLPAVTRGLVLSIFI